jgi:hypothetical protein
VAVQQLIRELIAIELPTAPPSDAALARLLAQQGFHTPGAPSPSIARCWTLTRWSSAAHAAPGSPPHEPALPLKKTM